MSNNTDKSPAANGEKPQLPKRLFWDTRFDELNWQKAYRTVISRVLERGTYAEWEELVRFYGRQTIIDALKNDITYLPDHPIEAICTYFNLKYEELACYAKKQSRKGHWI